MGRVSNTLDNQYSQIADPALRAILRETEDPRSQLAVRLKALEAEAQRLQSEGQRLTLDNAVFIAFTAAYHDALRRNRTRMNDVATDLQSSGIISAEQLTLLKAMEGIPDSAAAIYRSAWVRPRLEDIDESINYAQSGDYQDSLGKYETELLDINRRTVLLGLGALVVFRRLQQATRSLPAHYANSLLRSTQLNAYRQATSLYTIANERLLDGSIRIAVLDDRTCMACIALHGTILKPGELVSDHRLGRCDSIPIVKGRSVKGITTGSEWVESLSEDEQRNLSAFRKTPAKYDAWRSGAVRLEDFVGHDSDPVFGDIVYEQSLKGVLGQAAQEYYVR